MTTTGAQPVSLGKEDVLKPGDSIRTGRNGRVLLVRGEETIMISPNSVIGLPAEKKDGLSTTIVQRAGSILLEVEKRNVQHFEVETPYLAAVVKGTQFRVSVNAGSTSVNVIKGQVQVADFKSGQIAQVLPGQQATAFAGGNSGLSLSGSGTFSPIERGQPRAPSIDRVPVPKSGLTAPRQANASPVRAIGQSNPAAGAKPGTASLQAQRNAAAPARHSPTRISSALGEVKLNIHRVTNGLSRGAGQAHGAARNAAGRDTIWGPRNATATAIANGSSNAGEGGKGNGNGSMAGSSAAAAGTPIAVAAVRGNGNGNGGNGGNGGNSGNSGNNGGNGNGNDNGIGNGNGNGSGRGLLRRAGPREPETGTERRRLLRLGRGGRGCCGRGGLLRGLRADRRAARHLAQAGTRAVLRPEETAVLLGERVRDCARRDKAEVDEHFSERRAAAVLLGEGVQKLGLGQEALLDHDLAELSPGVGSRIHAPLIGGWRCRLKGYARSPASVQSTNASQWTPITSVCTASASTATKEAPSQGSSPRVLHASARLHAMNASIPSRPSSTPSSV
jgi:hypothetical protein